MLVKKIKRVLKWISKAIFYTIFGFIGLIFVATMLGSFFDFLDSNDEVVPRADGFTIDSYQVILDVHEDNKVDVTENITVLFDEEYHHGIYKFIPLWLEYTGRDDKTIKRQSNVYDLVAVGDEFSLDTVKGKKRIKIGSASEYVDIGLKSYQIKYTYDMGVIPIKTLMSLSFIVLVIIGEQAFLMHPFK